MGEPATPLPLRRHQLTPFVENVQVAFPLMHKGSWTDLHLKIIVHDSNSSYKASVLWGAQNKLFMVGGAGSSPQDALARLLDVSSSVLGVLMDEGRLERVADLQNCLPLGGGCVVLEPGYRLLVA